MNEKHKKVSVNSCFRKGSLTRTLSCSSGAKERVLEQKLSGKCTKSDFVPASVPPSGILHMFGTQTKTVAHYTQLQTSLAKMNPFGVAAAVEESWERAFNVIV